MPAFMLLLLLLLLLGLGLPRSAHDAGTPFTAAAAIATGAGALTGSEKGRPLWRSPLPPRTLLRAGPPPSFLHDHCYC